MNITVVVCADFSEGRNSLQTCFGQAINMLWTGATMSKKEFLGL